MNTLLLRDGIVSKQNRKQKTANRKTCCGQICNDEPDLLRIISLGFLLLGLGYGFGRFGSVEGGQRGFKGLRGTLQVPEIIALSHPHLCRLWVRWVALRSNDYRHLRLLRRTGGNVQSLQGLAKTLTKSALAQIQ